MPEFFFDELFKECSDSLSRFRSRFSSGLSGISDSFSSSLNDFADSSSEGLENIGEGISNVSDYHTNANSMEGLAMAQCIKRKTLSRFTKNRRRNQR